MVAQGQARRQGLSFAGQPGPSFPESLYDGSPDDSQERPRNTQITLANPYG